MWSLWRQWHSQRPNTCHIRYTSQRTLVYSDRFSVTLWKSILRNSISATFLLIVWYCIDIKYWMRFLAFKYSDNHDAEIHFRRRLHHHPYIYINMKYREHTNDTKTSVWITSLLHIHKSHTRGAVIWCKYIIRILVMVIISNYNIHSVIGWYCVCVFLST